MITDSNNQMKRQANDVIWKDVEGYDGKYQISSSGEVRSFSRWANGRILKGGICGNPGPYRYVDLIKEHRDDKKMHYIHRLVAYHFLDNPDNKKEVNHIDGNTLNNDVTNLEWCTRKENVSHASKMNIYVNSHIHQRGKLNPNSKAVIQKDLRGNFIKEWESVNQVMRECGFRASEIFKCCNPSKYPHCKTAFGYKWEYKNGQGKTNNSSKTKEKKC